MAATTTTISITPQSRPAATKATPARSSSREAAGKPERSTAPASPAVTPKTSRTAPATASPPEPRSSPADPEPEPTEPRSHAGITVATGALPRDGPSACHQLTTRRLSAHIIRNHATRASANHATRASANHATRASATTRRRRPQPRGRHRPQPRGHRGTGTRSRDHRMPYRYSSASWSSRSNAIPRSPMATASGTISRMSRQLSPSASVGSAS